MPTKEIVLAGLAQIATEQVSVAIIWHVLLAAALIARLAGRRPPRNAVAMLLIAPLLSVSALAWIYENPFNGAAFLLLAAVLGVIACRIAPGPLARAPRWSFISGVILTAFGWFYPHFLDSPLSYLYAAPMGLIPCPTLSVVIGLTLIAGGFGSRAWSYSLAGAGLFYGLIGTFRLGVWIDTILLAGACALAVLATRSGAQQSRGVPVGQATPA